VYDSVKDGKPVTLLMVETAKKAFRVLPNRFEGNCFGCSPVNPSGLQMKFSWNGRIMCSELVVPQHLSGWNRLIHGGVASTILDEVMSWAAIYTTRQMVMTKTMNTTFIKTIQIGERIVAQGFVKEMNGKHGLVACAEIRNNASEVCVSATANFAVFSQKVAKRLGIVHPDTPDPFFEG